MAAQAGLCLAWSETPEDTFCRVVVHFMTCLEKTNKLLFKGRLHTKQSKGNVISYSRLACDEMFSGVFRKPVTVNFRHIRTPKNFVVITLTFELCGSTI